MGTSLPPQQCGAPCAPSQPRSQLIPQAEAASCPIIPPASVTICHSSASPTTPQQPEPRKCPDAHGAQHFPSDPQLSCGATRARSAPQPSSNLQEPIIPTMSPAHVLPHLPPAAGGWVEPLTSPRGSFSQKGRARRTFTRSTTPDPTSQALKEATAQEEHPLVHRPRFPFLSRTHHVPCQGRGQQGQLLGPAATRRAITRLA